MRPCRHATPQEIGLEVNFDQRVHEKAMNPDDATDADEISRLTEAERAALEIRWYEGKMLHFVELLLAFVGRHRTEILHGAGGAVEPAALLMATKRFILLRGSVHMPSELTDQKLEMENECWYRGQEGQHDRTSIQVGWAQRHGKPWRQWRIREYLFVVDCCAERIVGILLGSAGG